MSFVIANKASFDTETVVKAKLCACNSCEATRQSKND